MGHHEDDGTVAHPEILTLHWEGPPSSEPAPDLRFPDSAAEERERVRAEQERERRETRRRSQGRALWSQIETEALRRGDESIWRRKLDAYRWVKVDGRGTAADYARRFDVKHATVRTWIADVAKLAYQVGYRLHEDRLLLTGHAPERLQRVRELVNRDAGSAAAWRALCEAEAQFRGEDPYFHLNEGHALRARGQLRASDETLKEGLALAEARPVRALLWNARGQTFWDCDEDSSWPLPDALARAERAFRRAAILDQSAWFPFVNLAHLAVDADDLRRAEYWVGELAAARKQMDEAMKRELARYLQQSAWTGPVEGLRFWRSGPLRWLAEAGRKGVLLLAIALGLALAAPPEPAHSEPTVRVDVETVAHGGGRTAKGGAGGN